MNLTTGTFHTSLEYRYNQSEECNKMLYENRIQKIAGEAIFIQYQSLVKSIKNKEGSGPHNDKHSSLE